MHVVYDHQIFSWQNYGGISKYFFEISRNITKYDGYDVEIVAPIYVNKYLKECSELNIVGTYMPRIPKTGRLLQKLNAGAVRNYLKRKPPTILHETYYYEKKLSTKRTRIVTTIHDMIHEKYQGDFPVLNNTIYRKRVSLKRADHIICVSNNTKEDLLHYYSDIKENKVSVIHLGYSLGNKKTQDRKAIIDRPYLAYVGERRSYKNFLSLLKAYSESSFLKDNIILVCFGGGRINNKEMKEIDRLKIDPRNVIHISGNDNVLHNIYSHAIALIYPSLYEGFGMPPLEAMSLGCPVICSKTSSIPEVCGNAAEYFEPNNIDSMRHAIEWTIESEERIQKLKQAGKERVKDFSWDKCARQTADLYYRLL